MTQAAPVSFAHFPLPSAWGQGETNLIPVTLLLWDLLLYLQFGVCTGWCLISLPGPWLQPGVPMGPLLSLLASPPTALLHPGHGWHVGPTFPWAVSHSHIVRGGAVSLADCWLILFGTFFLASCRAYSETIFMFHRLYLWLCSNGELQTRWMRDSWKAKGRPCSNWIRQKHLPYIHIFLI